MPARRQTATVAVLLLVIAGMVGLVAASVPLYQLFCRVTGYGGTTQAAQAAPGATGREITVRFDGSVSKDVPWRFQPAQREVHVRLGQESLAFFSATNTGDRPVVGTATFNVTPAKVGRYFNKIECFCFTQQRLEPGQTAEMPVTFFVDPALAEDENAQEVTTITLSYTFFRAPESEDRS